MKKKIEILLLFLIPAIILDGTVRMAANHLLGDISLGESANIQEALKHLPGQTVGEKITNAKWIQILSETLSTLVIAGWLFWAVEGKILIKYFGRYRACFSNIGSFCFILDIRFMIKMKGQKRAPPNKSFNYAGLPALRAIKGVGDTW